MLYKLATTLICIISFTGIMSVQADESWKGDISSSNFTISVKEITPGGADLIKPQAEATIDGLLKRTIERFIVAIGTIALFVMTIGAGMMILYTWDDERLTRWKTIFTGWLMAVGIALLSGLMAVSYTHLTLPTTPYV